MGKFKKALKKATSKRNNKKPKEKHLTTLHNYFTELPFNQVCELITKQLQEKRTPVRLRTLYVVHFLMINNYEQVINWFHTTNLLFEMNKQCSLNPLVGPYYNFLKLRSKHASTILMLINNTLLTTIKENPQELLTKIDELLNLMQTLVSIKDPYESMMKFKAESDYLPDICSRVLSDSKTIYTALKNAIGILWQVFGNFESYNANRAKDMFLRYNHLINILKIFSEHCAEEYPGQIPTYSLLNENTMEQVNTIVKGKENLNISKHLIGYEAVNRDGSPVKQSSVRTSLQGSVQPNYQAARKLSLPEMPVLASQPMVQIQPVQYVTGLPCYGMYPGTMMYPQQYYQPFPSNR
ncbi:hypothetical protein SteCoe_20049 [Stentor coeruleus]|uniref:AP180 N-terminal homology (ANTH) domain-containing protein n=1 Tax=Stentor coeruleus TaxID=5963 RepID=A0A1R2BT28_9CILI|nr:hypothetical protein SteCoe_20049 [Stentor coeruleus]